MTEMFLVQPRLARRLTRLALLEERALETRLTVIGRCRARERIAFFFLDIHDRLSRRHLINGNGFRFPVTQQQVADFLGLNIIYTNRVLRELRNRGIMTVHNHKVEIHQLASLRHLAPISIPEASTPLL
jgi:CRP-like cAMP-binding protein